MAESCNTFVFESPQPRVSIIAPRSKPGFVFSPGSPGPAGRDLQIDGTAENYEALLSVTPVRVGELWQVLNTGALYTWTTEGWPAEDQGRLLQGPQGDPGRGISALSIDGDDLVASMTRGPTERVRVPSIVASAASAAAAASSASLADGHRQLAQAARSGAETAQGLAEGHAVAAGEHADAAANSVTEASTHAVAAAGHADRAEGAETSAEQFAIEAGGHADTAANHATATTSAAEQVSLDRQAVTQDRNEVEGLAAGVQQVVNDGAAAVRAEVADDAAAAQTARQGAEAARDLAQGYSGTAQGAEVAAVAARGGAESARDAAVVAAGNAAASETAAAGFADTASAARDGAVSARTGAESARDEAEAKATIAANIATAEKIAELVGDAPEALDTIYELASALQDKGDALAAVQTALDNRVVGAFQFVVSETPPNNATPSNQITFVFEGGE